MSTTRKTPSRSPARPRGKPVEMPEVIKLSSDDPTPDKELVDLFEIDGEMYRMWLNPPASVGLRYLKINREQGTESGAQYLLETMLDGDGYDALMNYGKLTDEQFESIMKACEKYAVGAKEKRQGNG